jgi:hypothetical protein
MFGWVLVFVCVAKFSLRVIVAEDPLMAFLADPNHDHCRCRADCHLMPDLQLHRIGQGHDERIPPERPFSPGLNLLIEPLS